MFGAATKPDLTHILVISDGQSGLITLSTYFLGISQSCVRTEERSVDETEDSRSTSKSPECLCVEDASDESGSCEATRNRQHRL
jgi:hypothetical protein